MFEPRINLLPLHMKTQLARENRQDQLLLGLGIFAAILFLVYGLVTWSAARFWGETAYLKQEYAELIGKINQFRHYFILQEDIARQETLIKEVVGTDQNWSVILQNLVVNMPSNLWFTELTLVDKAELISEQNMGKVTIYGYAYEYQVITNWSQQIGQIPGLSKVNCSSTTKIDLNGESVISFKIDALVASS